MSILTHPLFLLKTFSAYTSTNLYFGTIIFIIIQLNR